MCQVPKSLCCEWVIKTCLLPLRTAFATIYRLVKAVSPKLTSAPFPPLVWCKSMRQSSGSICGKVVLYVGGLSCMLLCVCALAYVFSG